MVGVLIECLQESQSFIYNDSSSFNWSWTSIQEHGDDSDCQRVFKKVSGIDRMGLRNDIYTPNTIGMSFGILDKASLDDS